MINIQKYVRAQSLEEAYQLNQARTNRIVGGMLWMRLGATNVNTAIDLCDLGLDKIEEEEQQFSIGAMVSLRCLEQHDSLNAYTHNAVREAVKDIVGVQFRNMATIGGSIWGRFGFSDVLTVFLAMDTYVELYKGGILPLQQFVSMKPDNDILVRIIVKKTPGQIVYSSVRNQRTDFPVITCAVSSYNGTYRAAIGARPGRAVLITDTAGLVTGPVTPENAQTFASYVSDNVPTQSNVRASDSYRSHLIRVLTARCALELNSQPQ